MRELKSLAKVALWWIVVYIVFKILTIFLPFGTSIVISIALFVIVNILLIYLVLAPENLFFTFVPENKAKFIVSGNKLQKILLSSNQYTLANDYGVIPGKSEGVLGGLRFYGFWPLSDVLIYKFKWTNITESGEIISHNEILDTMILKTDMYLVHVDQAEDADLVPLDLKVVITARIVNPYKAMFIAQNWLEYVTNVVKAAVRNEMRKHCYVDLVGGSKGTHFTSLGANIFAQMEIAGEISELKNTYGVEISKIRIENIDPHGTDLRELTLKKIVAEKQAEADLIEAQGKAKAFKERAEAWKEEGVQPATGLALERLSDSTLNYTLLGGKFPDFLKDLFK